MRQKIVLLLLLLCLAMALPFFGQNPQMNFVDDADFKTDIENIFANVDKTLANTGFLYDYGMRFSDLTRYDGISLNPENLLDINDWGALYAPARVRSPDPPDMASSLGLAKDSRLQPLQRFATKPPC